MYPQNLEDLRRTIESDPNLADKLDKKDAGLDDRLKNVYVTSYGRPEDDITKEKIAKRNKDRPLPQDRKMVEFYEMGFKEPVKVKYGNTTLRDTINFVSAHQINPEEVTAAKIALEYKMKEEDVGTILKYFKTYEIYVPGTKKSPAVFAGPAQLRKKIMEEKLRQIEEKKLEEKKKEQIESLNQVTNGPT